MAVIAKVAVVFRVLAADDPPWAWSLMLRRSTGEEWSHANPVLLDREVGIDLTAAEVRIGDGRTPWAGLAPADGDAALRLLVGAHP